MNLVAGRKVFHQRNDDATFVRLGCIDFGTSSARLESLTRRGKLRRMDPLKSNHRRSSERPRGTSVYMLVAGLATMTSHKVLVAGAPRDNTGGTR